MREEEYEEEEEEGSTGVGLSRRGRREDKRSFGTSGLLVVLKEYFGFFLRRFCIDKRRFS